ncbi:MAG: GNAT family N-acetyltransferase [Nitrososphaerota archaeon]|nr:GNAT family N-acetyltransferase [Nitrososphaerota archaeon]MDG6938878.1 GNAT family N-acetyltransferase [Nitrososphaerota archaeon]
MDINMRTLPEHYSDEFYYDLLENFPEGFIIAVKGERVVGYVINRTEFGFSNVKGFSLTKKGHVVSVAILEEHRRKGLGRLLMEEALKAMVEKGCKEAFLEVRATNTAAVSLYEAMDFKTMDTLRHYYRDGEDARLMVKELD